MQAPPNLTRARELVRLIQQEILRLQADPHTCDPAVPSLAAHVGELTTIIDELPPVPNAASDEVKREMQWMTRRVLADAAWWLLKKWMESGGDD